MIVLYVLLWALLALVLLVLFLLALAIDYSVKASADDEVELVAGLSWAGILTGCYILGEGLQVRLLWFRLKTGGKSSRKSKVKGTAEATKSAEKTARRRARLPLGVRELMKMAKDLLRYLRPRILRADLRIGFDDPYYTGLMMAFVYTALHRFTSISITPVFDDTVLSGSFLMEGRVRPLALVFIALKTLVPAFLRNITRKMTKKREEAQSAGI